MILEKMSQSLKCSVDDLRRIAWVICVHGMDWESTSIYVDGVGDVSMEVRCFVLTLAESGMIEPFDPDDQHPSDYGG